MRSMAWCVGNLGKGGESAEREGRMGGGAWVVGVGQAGQAGEEVGGSRRSWKGGGRSGELWGQELGIQAWAAGGVGVGGGGGAGARNRTSMGSHAGRGMKNGGATGP